MSRRGLRERGGDGGEAMSRRGLRERGGDGGEAMSRVPRVVARRQPPRVVAALLPSPSGESSTADRGETGVGFGGKSGGARLDWTGNKTRGAVPNLGQVGSVRDDEPTMLRSGHRPMPIAHTTVAIYGPAH
jgi:hypothetical protein